ncbi:hypothetical protein PV325_003772 [Microctonus aethiopoides]|nr:hypothetical protein PV325_003772 [Microctonus aethiopoides]
MVDSSNRLVDSTKVSYGPPANGMGERRRSDAEEQGRINSYEGTSTPSSPRIRYQGRKWKWLGSLSPWKIHPPCTPPFYRNEAGWADKEAPLGPSVDVAQPALCATEYSIHVEAKEIKGEWFPARRGRERKACFPGTSRGAVSRRYCSANPRRVRVTNDAVIRPLVFLKAVPTLGKNQWKSPVAQGFYPNSKGGGRRCYGTSSHFQGNPLCLEEGSRRYLKTLARRCEYMVTADKRR